MAFKFQRTVFVKSATTPAEAHPDGRPHVAVAGRSNVGKSSLLNALAHQRQLARVSSTPGRTREINLFLVNDAFYLADLPGYGYAKVPKALQAEWGRQIEAYLTTSPHLRGVIVLFDIRRELRDEDAGLLDWLASIDRAVVPILTKIDKLRKNERARQAAAWRRALEPHGTRDPILFSAVDRTGKPDVLKAIAGLVGLDGAA